MYTKHDNPTVYQSSKDAHISVYLCVRACVRVRVYVFLSVRSDNIVSFNIIQLHEHAGVQYSVLLQDYNMIMYSAKILWHPISRTKISADCRTTKVRCPTCK